MEGVEWLDFGASQRACGGLDVGCKGERRLRDGSHFFGLSEGLLAVPLTETETREETVTQQTDNFFQSEILFSEQWNPLRKELGRSVKLSWRKDYFETGSEGQKRVN